MHDEAEAITLDPGSPSTVLCAGDIDLRSSPLLQKTIRGAAPEAGEVRIDLTNVPYIDSSGYGVMVEEARRLKEAGCRLTLLSPQRAVRHTLRLAGIVRYFEIQSSNDGPSSAVPPVRLHGWQHAAFTIPGRISLLGMARDRLMSIARTLPFSPDEQGEIELAVGEALSNAFRHGCSGEEHSISVECEANGAALTVRVTDPGQGFQPDAVPIPSVKSLQEGGMGLHFMKLTMDSVQYRFDENGTTVELIKHPKGVPDNPANRDSEAQ